MFIVAATGLLVGALLMRPLAEGIEPGLWWTSAHVAWLIGYLAFVPVLLELRALARPSLLGNIVGLVGVLGALAISVQMVADLVAGLQAATRDELRAGTGAFRALPGVDLAVYGVGPQLLYVGVLGLVLLLALRRTIPLLPAVGVGVGTVLYAAGMIAGRNPVLQVTGLVVLCVGLVGIAYAGRRQTGKVIASAP